MDQVERSDSSHSGEPTLINLSCAASGEPRSEHRDRGDDGDGGHECEWVEGTDLEELTF